MSESPYSYLPTVAVLTLEVGDLLLQTLFFASLWWCCRLSLFGSSFSCHFSLVISFLSLFFLPFLDAFSLNCFFLSLSYFHYSFSSNSFFLFSCSSSIVKLLLLVSNLAWGSNLGAKSLNFDCRWNQNLDPVEHCIIVARSEYTFEVPALSAVGERSFPLPLVVEIHTIWVAYCCCGCCRGTIWVAYLCYWCFQCCGTQNGILANS